MKVLHREGSVDYTLSQYTTSTFLAFDKCSELAGMSIRNFRRIVEDEKLPVVFMGRKRFILGRDYNDWLKGKKEAYGC